MPTYYVGDMPFSSDLYHHGITGQKWGIRRFQNSDGSLTPDGRGSIKLWEPDSGRKV